MWPSLTSSEATGDRYAAEIRAFLADPEFHSDSKQHEFYLFLGRVPRDVMSHSGVVEAMLEIARLGSTADVSRAVTRTLASSANPTEDAVRHQLVQFLGQVSGDDTQMIDVRTKSLRGLHRLGAFENAEERELVPDLSDDQEELIRRVYTEVEGTDG